MKLGFKPTRKMSLPSRLMRIHRNFDFDDLYSLSKEKVAKLTESGKKKIQNGISYAGNFMRKYVRRNANTDINEDADFNSYDINLKNDFSASEPN